MDACMEVDGKEQERRGNIYIYQKGYQHGQAIQLLSVIMLYDLRVTMCVCLEGSALFHIKMFRVGAKIRLNRETGNTGIFFFCLIITNITTLDYI